MGDLILYACLTFFSAYGIFSLLFFVKDFLWERKFLKGKCLYSLVFVKNEACRVEMMVKALLFKLFKNDTGLCDRKIIVVDEGSIDGTYETLKTVFSDERSVIVFRGKEDLKNLKKI